MANHYDKILKENFEEIILPMVKSILNISLENTQIIPNRLQKTIEREADFLRKVLNSDGKPDYILHIEVQVKDEKKMVNRMLEYCALLLRKYNIPIRQYVFYIGKKRPVNMVSELNYDNLSFKYQLIDFQTIAYEKFLNSDIPEEIILAILCNFHGEKPTKVISQILIKLRSLISSNLDLGKFTTQLEVISNLRNLEAETVKLIEDMPITIDISKSIRFQQGREEGIGVGIKKHMNQTIEKMLNLRLLSIQQIAEINDVSVKYVEKIAKTLSNKKSSEN
jgi:predicted transposase/invertase (TIGR01784 family)